MICSTCQRPVPKEDRARVYMYWGPCDLDYGPAQFLFKALERLPRLEVYRFECRIPPHLLGKADLHLMVDWAEDTTPYKDYLPDVPRAYWMSDTHVNHASRDYRIAKAMKCNIAYCNIHSDEGLFRLAPVPVHWLPYAVEPLLWKPHPEIEQTIGVGFLGHYGNYPERERFLTAMTDEFGEEAWIGAGRFVDDAVTMCARFKIVLNHAQGDSTNMRTFEAMSMGACLLQPATGDLEKLGFENGKHLVTYRSVEEAVDQVHWYLDHPGARQAIGECARKAILEKHTYIHRAIEFAGVAGWKTGWSAQGLDIPGLIETPWIGMA